VPKFSNGFSYPAPGYTVSQDTTVYTHCVGNYAVQHRVLESRPCGQLDSAKSDFPNCYGKSSDYYFAFNDPGLYDALGKLIVILLAQLLN
jgi:hypothetical protein